jgi:hypothetical protein
MATLVWRAPMRYYSPGDETAFFAWLQAISGVLQVRGDGRELHIALRSKRLSAPALRELLALYQRYGGNMRELAVFANPSNESWFKASSAEWHSEVFGRSVAA